MFLCLIEQPLSRSLFPIVAPMRYYHQVDPLHTGNFKTEGDPWINNIQALSKVFVILRNTLQNQHLAGLEPVLEIMQCTTML